MSFSRSLCFTLASTLSLVATGCDTTPPVTTPTPSAAIGHDDHGHDHAEEGHSSEGPHHGVLVELGNEEYHAEVVHDDATGTVTVYLLDSSAKLPASTTATEATINLKLGDTPQQFKLAAQPEQGNPAGQTSRFTLADQKLVESLDSPDSSAKLNVMIDEVPRSGAIPAASAHGHHH